MNYEFMHSVQPVDYENIAIMFGVDPEVEMHSIIQQITEGGKGEAIRQAPTEKVIPNELFPWRG